MKLIEEAIAEYKEELKWEKDRLDFGDYPELQTATEDNIQKLEQLVGWLEELSCLKKTKDLYKNNNNLVYQQGREDAIEEFASAISNKDNIIRYDIDEIMSNSGNFDYACNCLREYVDAIAEETKTQALLKDNKEYEGYEIDKVVR